MTQEVETALKEYNASVRDLHIDVINLARLREVIDKRKILASKQLKLFKKYTEFLEQEVKR